MYHKIMVMVLLILSGNYAIADTTTIILSYPKAQAILLKENLTMLAAYYDVSTTEAELVQARLWNNPNLVWNQDLYSVEQNKYFNFRNQRLLQIEQTISLAGKHTNTVKLARLGLEVSKLQFQDVVRSLLYELGQVYFNLAKAKQLEKLYTQTLNQYSQLISNANERLKVGAISTNEVLRLRSEEIDIKAEATQNKNDVLEYSSQLKVLLNLAETVSVELEEFQVPSELVITTQLLIDSALTVRPDYKLQLRMIDYEEQNLKLQKSLIVPDATFGYQPHDKGSNYVRPYQGLTLEINMPLFNRNQGNIKMAKSKIEQAKVKVQQLENVVRNEVDKSYRQYLNSRSGIRNFNDDFLNQTEELYNNTNSNYSRKNINLLEFIDLQRIYIKNKIQFINLRTDYMHALNNLSFYVGRQITN